MKIRRIFNESSNIEDMSKDRIHLNLSLNEWLKIENLIDLASWESPKGSRLKKKAQNLRNCIKNAQELEPIWVNKKGRAK